MQTLKFKILITKSKIKTAKRKYVICYTECFSHLQKKWIGTDQDLNQTVLSTTPIHRTGYLSRKFSTQRNMKSSALIENTAVTSSA